MQARFRPKDHEMPPKSPLTASRPSKSSSSCLLPCWGPHESKLQLSPAAPPAMLTPAAAPAALLPAAPADLMARRGAAIAGAEPGTAVRGRGTVRTAGEAPLPGRCCCCWPGWREGSPCQLCCSGGGGRDAAPACCQPDLSTSSSSSPPVCSYRRSRFACASELSACSAWHGG